jgi:hypothetical protein
MIYLINYYCITNLDMQKHTSIMLLLILCSIQKITAQELIQKPTKKKTFEFGIGMPSISLRDQTTSDLVYRGTGLAAVTLANHKVIDNKSYKEFRFNFLFNSAAAVTNPTNEWNKKASVFSYSLLWRKLKMLGTSKNKTWQFFGGLGFGNGLQFNIIPSANNSLSYDMNWLNASLEGMAKKSFNWKRKSFQFTYQASLPILGVSVRPLSYIGLMPANTIWQQNNNTFDIFFQSPKLSSLHNNLVFRNDISLDMPVRKNKLRLQYFWQYKYNTISVNTLNNAASAVHLAYLIQLNKK